MKLKSVVIAIFVALAVVPLLVLCMRFFIVDWFVVATDRFEPEIQKEQWLWICRSCADFKTGEYVVFFSEEQGNYMIEKVLRDSDTETVEVTSLDSLSQEVRLQNVHGKVIID